MPFVDSAARNAANPTAGTGRGDKDVVSFATVQHSLQDSSVASFDSGFNSPSLTSLEFEEMRSTGILNSTSTAVDRSSVEQYVDRINDLSALVTNCSTEDLVELYVGSMKRLSSDMEGPEEGAVKSQLADKISTLSFEQRLGHLGMVCQPLENDPDGNILSVLICEQLPVVDVFRTFASLPQDMKPKLVEYFMHGVENNGSGDDNELVELSNREVGEILGKAVAKHCYKSPNEDEHKNCGEVFKYLAIATQSEMKAKDKKGINNTAFMEEACTGYLSSCSIKEQTNCLCSIVQVALRQYSSNDVHQGFLASRLFIALIMSMLTAQGKGDAITIEKVVASTARLIECGKAKQAPEEAGKETTAFELVFGCEKTGPVTHRSVAPLFHNLLACFSSLDVLQKLWESWNDTDFTKNSYSNTSLSVMYATPHQEVEYIVGEILKWIFLSTRMSAVAVVPHVLENMPVNAKAATLTLLLEKFTAEKEDSRNMAEPNVTKILSKQPLFLEMQRGAMSSITSLFYDLVQHTQAELDAVQEELKLDSNLSLIDMSPVLELLTEEERQEIADENGLHILNSSLAAKMVMGWVEYHSEKGNKQQWLREYFVNEEVLFLFLCNLALKSVGPAHVGQVETLKLQVSADDIIDDEHQREMAYPTFQRCNPLPPHPTLPCCHPRFLPPLPSPSPRLPVSRCTPFYHLRCCLTMPRFWRAACTSGRNHQKDECQVRKGSCKT
jgi:hypothetical protein